MSGKTNYLYQFNVLTTTQEQLQTTRHIVRNEYTRGGSKSKFCSSGGPVSELKIRGDDSGGGGGGDWRRAVNRQPIDIRDLFATPWVGNTGFCTVYRYTRIPIYLVQLKRVRRVYQSHSFIYFFFFYVSFIYITRIQVFFNVRPPRQKHDVTGSFYIHYIIFVVPVVAIHITFARTCYYTYIYTLQTTTHHTCVTQ